MRRDTGTLVLLGAAHSLNHSLFLVLPPLLGEISRDLGASFQSIGFIATVSFLLYGLGALVGGPLSDRFGEVRVISLSIALAGASTAVFLLPKSLGVFSAGMYLIAAWASFYHPTANTLISKRFVENTGGAMGVHGAAGSLGQILTPVVAYVLGIYLDWKFAFAFVGLLSVVVGLLLLRIPSPDGQPQAEKASLRDLLALPNIWIIVVFNVFIGLYQRGVELFFPAFLTASRGFSGEMAAVASSAALLFAVLGQLVGGWATDRWSAERVLAVASMGMVAGILLLLLSPFHILGTALFVVVFGIAFYGHQPAGTSLLGKVSPKEMMGTAYGLMFFFAFGLGSVSTTIVGYVADAFNLERAFWVMALFATMALVVALTIPRVVRLQPSGREVTQ
ncbi:MAG: MFS transporter [Candidatus Bathyarchaeota archaeon]|nr:MAG: MFS transporter [Candidatus Bathyarchaeota archaeon]